MSKTSIRDIALDRVNFVFGRTEGGVRLADRFDLELKARPPNDFRANEFDVLLEDVNQMRSGGIGLDREILTVQDFCVLVEQYALDQPRGWEALSREWEKERALTRAPVWRRAIWRLIGV
jgi:hypothetical protein